MVEEEGEGQWRREVWVEVCSQPLRTFMLRNTKVGTGAQD